MPPAYFWESIPETTKQPDVHLAPFIKGKIRLEKFDEKVTRKMFLEAKHPKKDIPALLKESLGYPFLVQLLCEAKGGTVSFYQQFYERTTRWMAPTEKSWVLPLCYLDQVTEESVAKMLPDYSPETVMEWFKHEASIRDPQGKCYAVAPYIRRTLLEYNRLTIGKKSHEELVTKGRDASRDD
jgi:hypothetical protein